MGGIQAIRGCMNRSDIFVSLEAHMQEMERRQTSCCLAVEPQQVVHPVLTEEAEVAEASDSEGKPDEHA